MSQVCGKSRTTIMKKAPKNEKTWHRYVKRVEQEILTRWNETATPRSGEVRAVNIYTWSEGLGYGLRVSELSFSVRTKTSLGGCSYMASDDMKVPAILERYLIELYAWSSDRTEAKDGNDTAMWRDQLMHELFSDYGA
jgi:hypothetical protein